MKNIIKFTNFYKDISTFGTSRIDDIESPNKEILNITTQEFLELLYINVPTEYLLKEKLKDDTLGKLIALCGPSGCGKSSVSLKVKHDISGLNYLVIFLDFKIEYATELLDNNFQTIDETRIRELILNSFNKEFPKYAEDTYSKKDDLLYFLLSSEKEIINRKQDQIFLDFQELMDETLYIYKKHTHTRKQNFKEWFYENLSSAELIKIQMAASKKINISHFAHYIIYNRLYNKIIIWIDNIDSFSNLQQSLIAGFLHRIERSILNLCQIVISAREENVYRMGAYNEKYSEPFTSMVSFTDPDRLQATAYGAINIPVIDLESLKNIIGKKITFGKIKFKYKYPNTAINETIFNELVQLSLKICDCLDSEKVIFLANNSIREYLNIHSKFLHHLVKNNKDSEHLTDLKIQNRELTTKFLSWIYKINEPFKMESFNVLEEAGKYINNPNNQTSGCFLPYLILTRIWNKCMKLTGLQSPNNNPYLSDIINDIKSDFCFEEEVILETLFNLLHRNFGQGNFITFRSKIKVQSPKDLKTFDTTVRITYRGKVTVGSIINSYGYFTECINIVKNYKEEKMDIDELVIEKIKFLIDIHLQSLKKLKQTKYSHNEKWYTDYLSRYGLPLESPFVRHKDIGLQLSNVKNKRCLYVECLIASLLAFYNYSNKSMKNQIIEIRSEFNKELEKFC